jgi:hypothetical protein
MPDDRPKPEKAKIVNVANTSQSVTCHFNPKQFELKRTVIWNTSRTLGHDAPELSFGGGEAAELSIEFLFDTTDTGQDVRNTYKLLLDLSKVDTTKKDPKTQMSEPPLCRFEWGKFLSFTAVITKVAQTFTMFKPDGTPVRAKVDVTFKQVDQPTGAQNPTTRSEPRKIWVVHEGQTLDWIAYQEYGDPACWRHIAETNDLADPVDLRPGQVLKLVPLQ